MIRKIRWVALATLATMVLACGHGGARQPAPEVSPVTLDAALGNKFVKAGASSTMVARIGLAAKKRSSTARPPVNLALLVDTSGSMEGRAIEDARAASLALIASLSPEDRIAVVVFNSKAEVLLPSTKLDDTNAKELRKKISGMQATGTTDMASGLRMALDEVTRNLVREGVNRVVLVGDGVPNDDRQINSLVATAAASGVSITALGLGNDYDETLMGRIAQQSGGRFFYVEDSTKVASFLSEEVTRLHKVVARHAVLELNPGPGVSVLGVVGRPIAISDRSVSVQLGDLSLDEQAEVVVELAGGASKEGANVEVLDAVLRYDDGFGGGRHEERIFVGARSTGDASSLEQGRVKPVEDALARAKDAAATLRRIETQRSQVNANQKLPAPVAPKRLDLTSVVPNPVPESAEQLRKAHDQAIKNFQSY